MLKTQEVSDIKIGICTQYVDDVKVSNISPGTQNHFEIATSSWMVLWPIDPWRFVHSRCGFYVLVVFWMKRVGYRYNILYWVPAVSYKLHNGSWVGKSLYDVVMIKSFIKNISIHELCTTKLQWRHWHRKHPHASLINSHKMTWIVKYIKYPWHSLYRIRNVSRIRIPLVLSHSLER